MSKNLNLLISNILNPCKDWKISLLQNWKSIVGSLSERIRLEKICDNMLIIGVYESHWMQELFLLSKVLLNNINNYLGKEYIKQLKFKLVEKKISKKSTTKRHNPIRQNLILHSTQKYALEGIKDEQLRSVLVNFWNRCIS